MLYEKDLRNKHFIKETIQKIRSLKLNRKVNLMEVCGTHTYSFFRFGLRGLLTPYVNLISGPGCPVCITENSFIDKAVYLTKNKNNIVATFGDLVKVPGSQSSLLREKSKGANTAVVYSPYEALKLAENNKDKTVIFLGVGFETTAPLVAATVKEAKKRKVNNFYVLSGHRLVPPAMEVLCQDKDINIDGFICPGHVSAIIGEIPYRKLVKNYAIGCVICGFEPLDMVLGIYMMLKQIKNNTPKMENEYKRVVKEKGNPLALKIMHEVFQVNDAGWRGVGVIPDSGLFFNKKYAGFDADTLVKVKIKEKTPATGCLCPEVIKGKATPLQCVHFKNNCAPANPIGPCMVSFEGTCRIYYEYEK